jgi:hypothetical protein
MTHYNRVEQAGPKSEVIIIVSCKNLKDRDVTSKSDPICVLFMKDMGLEHFREVSNIFTLLNLPT